MIYFFPRFDVGAGFSLAVQYAISTCSTNAFRDVPRSRAMVPTFSHTSGGTSM
jgi:hypothetical protein